jgi:hypothetical protein
MNNVECLALSYESSTLPHVPQHTHRKKKKKKKEKRSVIRNVEERDHLFAVMSVCSRDATGIAASGGENRLKQQHTTDRAVHLHRPCPLISALSTVDCRVRVVARRHTKNSSATNVTDLLTNDFRQRKRVQICIEMGGGGVR